MNIKTPAILQLTHGVGDKWFTRTGGVLTPRDLEALRSDLVSQWCREIQPALNDHAKLREACEAALERFRFIQDVAAELGRDGNENDDCVSKLTAALQGTSNE